MRGGYGFTHYLLVLHSKLLSPVCLLLRPGEMCFHSRFINMVPAHGGTNRGIKFFYALTSVVNLCQFHSKKILTTRWKL